ncbi:MAG: hypothetical protein HOO06_11415 [Bdellovibrionaceae bacterium]|nr:hypothetical protein [Pseudobdellovibrionaceae bacterium]
MKKLLLMVLFFVWNPLFASENCPMDFKNTELCADLTWIDGPYVDEKSHFKIMFWKKGDSEKVFVSPDYDLDIYTYMIMDNGHSHRGGIELEWLQVSAGVFESKNARFYMHGMKGFWEVRVGLIQADSIVSQSAYKVDLENTGMGH